MSIPKSLQQPLRQALLPVGAGWRAYFAPFNQALAVANTSTALGPTIYDFIAKKKFLDGPPPPSPWVDIGWVKDVNLAPGSKIGNVPSGYRGAVRAKYRAEVAEKCTFKMMEMSRLGIKIATGCQVFNLIATTASAGSGPLSTSGTAAIAMSGYTASGSVSGYEGYPVLTVASSPSSFPAGSFIVCDQDYNNTDFGYVGDAGANVYEGAVNDVDFIRKTSDYVATVKAVVGNDLILTKPFMGGGNNATSSTANMAPSAGAKVQRIYGYGPREGGTFLMEWSAMFVMDLMSTGQILIYYPRLSPDAFGGLPGENLQNATSLQIHGLQASLEAMAFDDPLDGETVIRYGPMYFPPPAVDIQA